MQEPKAKARTKDAAGADGELRQALEGIQENEECGRGGGGGRPPRRGGIVRERRRKFEGGKQMQSEISRKIELIEESEYCSESGNEDRTASKGCQKGTPNVGTPASVVTPNPGTPNSLEFPASASVLRGSHRRGGGRLGGGRPISSSRVRVAEAYDAVSASMRGKIHKDVATMVERLHCVETQTAETRSASTGIEKGELDSLATEKSPNKKHVKVIRSIFEPFPDDTYFYDTSDDPLALAGRRSKSPVPTSRRYPPPRTPTPKREPATTTTTKRVIAGMERPITDEIYARERDDDSPKQHVSITDHFDTLLATIEAEEEAAKKRRMQRKKDAATAADREIKKLGIDFDNRLAPAASAAAAAAAATTKKGSTATAAVNPAGTTSRGKPRQNRRTFHHGSD